MLLIKTVICHAIMASQQAEELVQWEQQKLQQTSAVLVFGIDI